MTAGTGDGEERTCGNCATVLCNWGPGVCPHWTPSKPQPQVAPTPLDILAVLADFIPKINQTCDQLHAKSLVLEDDYCKAGDKANAIFDLCGELQEDYLEIVNDEFQQEG